MDLIKATLVRHQISLALLISSTIGYNFLRKLQKTRREKLESVSRPLRLVVITGCDSGLGLSMASWAAHLGYHVLAGCLSSQSEGAQYLERDFQNNVTIAKLDVTDEESILQFRKECENLLQKSNTKLWAVISNAAVLVLGEFFWQTKNQRERQMKVNYEGAVNLTLAFQPLLFQHQCRLIIISSDCTSYSLPGLSVYASSKAALESWARALRLEVSKYGVTVVCLQPGDFTKETQVLSRTIPNFEEMESSMLEEDKEFYADYYSQWKERKCNFSSAPNQISQIKPLENETMKNDFVFLLEGDVKYISVYKRETPFQKILHFIVDYLPMRISDQIICKLMNFGAKWDSTKKYLPHSTSESSNNTNGWK